MGQGHFTSLAHTTATGYPHQSGMLDMEMPTGDVVEVATAASSRVTEQPLTPDGSGLQSADGTSSSTEFFWESSTFDFMNKTAPRGPSLSNIRVFPCAVIAGKMPCSLATSSPSAPIFDGLALGLGTDDAFGLPHRFVADRLVDAYFKFRHPLNAYLHENSFRSRYRRLWFSEDLGGEEATQNNLAWLGLVNLVFAFGSKYARVATDILRFFKRAKTLVFSGLLQAGSIELIQALLLMGQYLHGSLELKNCWTVVGLAIRTAQGLGLHLDRGEFAANVVEHEVRKRFWWGCFILDRVLRMKVGRPPTIHDGPVDASKPKLTDIPNLFAISIQLEGDLDTWQQALPAHLHFDSQVQGWHFECQRNTLLMRFLSCWLLVHRQVLLIYITRQITDSFQRKIMHSCARRSIMAAHDTMRQMLQLHQRHLLHLWWHNSHHVFAALGVLLAFQTLDAQSKAEVGLVSVDVDRVILRGTHLLEEVGDQMHPLVSRYVQSFHQLQSRLRTISTTRAYALTDSIGLPCPAPADSSILLDGDDFSDIEDLLYTTDWTSLMADWSES
ncbi:hypothetical protein PILCRDRAFT_825147 [Piloderma croceum F 1598]|uniref:Xylanolytic transcriptional activator regulatory domain-containing protein n=1 Tax=Piloderma croceum (strain F 1598) TaxID=765440 RepID=A0A0C3BK43_PILCF|nr:hypothetical protein PILCRDRAFT_825147 [Piloderma croceum F 1598]